MVTVTRVREILQAAAHPQGGFLTSGFQVQKPSGSNVIVQFYDAEAVVCARPAELERHLLQYAATLQAAGLSATRHEHYLLVSDLYASCHRSDDVRAMVAAEIERCIEAIVDAVGLDATRPGSQYAELFMQLRYPASPLSVSSFNVPSDMLAFVELLRSAPTLEIAAGRWTRRSCMDTLRRIQLCQQLSPLYTPMIKAIEALSDA